MEEKTESLDTIGLKYAYNYGKGKNYTGGDKTSLGKNFTKHYEILFKQMHLTPINLLELGVFHGKSLAMWGDYFANGTIYGIDRDLQCYNENFPMLKKCGAFKNENVKVYEQDITKDDFKKLIEQLPRFDIIIDDALHVPLTQFNNFMLLFNKLNSGGYYIIEDVIDPIKFNELFRDLMICISNIECEKIKKNKMYSIAVKIESIEIKQNLFIIKKKH